MARTRPDERACVGADALTAFVLGEGDGVERERVARHLLGCAPCRSRRDAEAALLRRLQAFADLGAWEEDLARADAALRHRRRRLVRGALAGGVAAAALAALLVGRPHPPDVEAPTAPSARDALLSAQATDGRWRSATGVERHDVGATGLAVLALLRDDPDAVRSGPSARALSAAVKWLAPRAAQARDLGERERAAAAAALEAVHAATRDRAIGLAAERARRSLPRERPALPPADPSSVLALVRAL